MRKLTKTEIEQVLKLRQEGKQILDIARLFCVPKTTINKIVQSSGICIKERYVAQNYGSGSLLEDQVRNYAGMAAAILAEIRDLMRTLGDSMATEAERQRVWLMDVESRYATELEVKAIGD